jgi:hypothetical protein
MEAMFSSESPVSMYKIARYENPEADKTIFVTAEKSKVFVQREMRKKIKSIIGDKWKETGREKARRERTTDLDTGQQARVNKP